MVRIGIVGIGGFGWHMAENIQLVSAEAGCRLVAAAETRMAELPEQAAQLEGRGVRLFTDAIKMYDAMAGKCEAIYVTTGIGSHEALTVEALGRGYHVHVEKPPSATIQAVDRMAAAADAADRFCIVGYQAVHNRDMQFIKQRIVEGALGRIKTIACHAGWPRTRQYYTRNEWAGRLRTGSQWILDGPASNALLHQINNMLLLASDQAGQFATPAAVRAELYVAGPVDSHDTAAIEIHTADGPTCFFLASHCSDDTFGPVIEVIGEKGKVAWQKDVAGQLIFVDGTRQSVQASPGKGRHRIVADFVKAIRTSDASLLGCDINQARSTTLAVNGAYESSRRVRRIDGKFTRRLDEGTDGARTVVEGLDELIIQAAEQRKLFSDLAEKPDWAVPTQPFDLTGYGKFPVQFACPEL